MSFVAPPTANAPAGQVDTLTMSTAAAPATASSLISQMGGLRLSEPELHDLLEALNLSEPQLPEWITSAQNLLAQKVAGVYNKSVKSLNLGDILRQSSKTMINHHVPPDISLAWFLENRGRINAYTHAQKEDQPYDITRAFFYYDLDPIHKFSPYATVRSNVAVFCALLGSKTSKLPTTESKKFVRLYLEAVLEWSNELGKFVSQEAFIAFWKECPYDLFCRFYKSQQKRMAGSKLRDAWKRELESREKHDPEVMEGISLLVPALIPGPNNLPVTVAYGEEDEEGDGAVVEPVELEDVSQTPSMYTLFNTLI